MLLAFALVGAGSVDSVIVGAGWWEEGEVFSSSCDCACDDGGGDGSNTDGCECGKRGREVDGFGSGLSVYFPLSGPQ